MGTTEYGLTKVIMGVVVGLCVIALGLVAVLSPGQLAPLATILVPVSAVALSILSGSYAVSRGMAKGRADAPKVPPVATLLLLALPLLVGGCSLTPLQQLKTATDGAYQIEQVVIPRWNARCEAAATKCAADGVTVADKCDLLRSCQKDRGYLVKSLAGVHAGVVMAAPLVGLGKDSEAAAYITASLRALHNASLIAQKSGFLGGGK